MKKIYAFVILFCLFCNTGFSQNYNVQLGSPINTTGWAYATGTSFANGNTFTLTSPIGDATGYIYYNTPENLTACAQFTVDFDFQIIPPTASGYTVADGIAFWYIENLPTISGTQGTYLGLPLNPNGIVTILDTYDNDGNGNNPLETLLGYDGTTQYYIEGDNTGLLAPVVPNQDFITDGQWHHCEISYTEGSVKVYLNNNPIPFLSGTYLLSSVPRYFGFSASTGYDFSTQNIRNVSIVGYTVPPPPTALDTVSYCQYAVADTLTTITGSGLRWYTDGATPGTLDTLAGAPTPNTSVITSTTYYVAQQPVVCISELDTIHVNVYPQPSAPVITGDTAYCFGATTIPFSVNGPGALWYANDTGAGDTTAPVINTSAPGLYTYYATQTVNGCKSAVDSISVNVKPLTPVPTVDSNVSYCQYDSSISLQGDVNGQNLLWYTNPPSGPGSPAAPVPSTLVPDTTAFYVSQTINNCESDSVPVSVVVIQKPNLLFNISDTQICLFNTSTLTYTGDASGFAQFNWSLPANTSLVSGNGPGPLVIQFNAAGVSQVNFNVVDYGCSSDDTTLNITVIKSPAPTINYPKDVCYGQPATVYFNDTSATSGSDIYYWGWDRGNVSDGSGPGPYTVTWFDAGPHTLSLSVVVNNCASDTTKDTINVHPLPDVQIAPLASNDVCAGDSLLLQANTATVPVYAYQWSPYAYFQTDNNKAAVYGIIDTPGYVYVRAVSDYGCVNTDSLLLTTHPCCDVVLPNAFTPNHDGHNDVFRIIGLYPQKVVDFRVFDRWGKIVYNATDEKGWDGTTNGTAVPIDTYYYTLTYVCNDGREYHKKGNVTVVR